MRRYLIPFIYIGTLVVVLVLCLIKVDNINLIIK